MGEKMLVQQQADSVDTNSLAAGPLFVDPVSRDFRFKPTSPALELGIVPIDISRIGLRKF